MQIENESRTVDLLFDTFEEAYAAAKADNDPTWKAVSVAVYTFEPWQVGEGKKAYKVVRVRRRTYEHRPSSASKKD